MAKQHFYSRVPAKMSMFNRMDGYDTFAYSEGIEREQIEIDIAEVYDNKPSKDDATLIMAGGLPTVYSAFTNDSGTVIESAMSFLPKDYTGERSAYMVHSLLLDGEEKAAHYESLNGLPFDKSVFKTNLDDFDLTSFDSKPSRDYPELAIPASTIGEISAVSAKYDVGMMKRAIYTMFMLACGKIKTLYLGMPGETDTLSADTLELINALISVFPYHMRYQLSFVTYVGDITKFSSFKIKGMSEKLPPAPTAKGVTLRMGMHDFYGVTDENIAANAAVVDFFYSLLTDEHVRREFLDFASGAVSFAPELNKPTVKNVTELVFLFRVLSGYYEEKSVLPNDDELYSYICIYDKYRGAMTDEYRARAMKPLRRYVEKGTAIPKNIFGKVSSLYADETPVSKHGVMSTVLELFHTEAMRDKLFAFIKANYADEDATSKNKIMHSVCRVYYGGFLQDSIIEFFTKYFPTEPADIRSEILDRLLLTVRTPKIQSAVLSFLDTYYDNMSDDEKSKFYDTFVEMLPDADSLTRALADIVDSHIEDDRKDAISAAIIKAVTNDEKHKEPKLISTLVTRCGYVEATVAAKIIDSMSEKPAFEKFATAITKKPLADKIETVREIWTAMPKVDATVSEKLLSAIKDGVQKAGKTSIFTVIEAVDKLDEIKAELPASSDFASALESTALYPLVLSLIPTVFEQSSGTDAIDNLVELAKKRSYIAKSDAYKIVKTYHDIIKEAKNANGEAVFTMLTSIEGESLRKSVALSVKKNMPKLDGEALVFVNAAISYVTAGEFSMADSFASLKDSTSKSLRDSGTQTDEASAKADAEALKLILSVSAKLKSLLPDEVKSAMTSATSGTVKCVNAFINRNEKKGKKLAFEIIDSLEADGDFKAEVKKNVSVDKSAGGFFAKLFGKK